eukprot:gene13424-biopygen3544
MIPHALKFPDPKPRRRFERVGLLERRSWGKSQRVSNASGTHRNPCVEYFEAALEPGRTSTWAKAWPAGGRQIFQFFLNNNFSPAGRQAPPCGRGLGVVNNYVEKSASRRSSPRSGAGEPSQRGGHAAAERDEAAGAAMDSDPACASELMDRHVKERQQEQQRPAPAESFCQPSQVVSINQLPTVLLIRKSGLGEEGKPWGILVDDRSMRLLKYPYGSIAADNEDSGIGTCIGEVLGAALYKNHNSGGSCVK